MAVPFGKYELLRKLATGGMGQIFLARPEGAAGLSQLVVVKRLLPHLANHRNFLHMFLDEAKIASRLDHPNIVRIHELGQEHGSHFLVMDYVSGEDLRTLSEYAAAAGKPVPLGAALRIVADAASGLHHAHQATDSKGRRLGLIHRDVSPPNILVGFDGVTKLIDFGVAKAAGRLQETATGFLKGKYPYMSPEQVDAQKLDHRSDVFSLGVVLWELCAGQRLFKGQNELITARLVSDCSVPPPQKVNRALPKEIDDLVLAALQRTPDARYPDAAAFRTAIESFVAASGVAGAQADVAGYLQSLYADRIASEKDEAKQHVLWGTLDEASTQGTQSGGKPPGAAGDEEDTAPGDERPDLEERMHTASFPRYEPPLGWRRAAAVVGAVLVLGGAAAVMYARSHREAKVASPRR